MRKQKPSTFPAAKFGDRLDQLLSDAHSAGVSLSGIAAALEHRAQVYRKNAAISVNLSVVPVTYDAWGKRLT
jgi:hypothetical protein